jgi:hypothetical protein
VKLRAYSGPLTVLGAGALGFSLFCIVAAAALANPGTSDVSAIEPQDIVDSAFSNPINTAAALTVVGITAFISTPTLTPSDTSVPTASETLAPSSTPIRIFITWTPTRTRRPDPRATLTYTPTRIPTRTPSRTPTRTPTRTATIPPSPTDTLTPRPTFTFTLVPTQSNTPLPPTETNTPRPPPTVTVTSVDTPTVPPTSTPAPPATPANTATPGPLDLP